MPKVGIQPIRRQQLIDATIVCLEEYGLAETTIAHIAQQAGLSTGIISHYFGGKMGLLKETMLELMRQLHRNIATKKRTEISCSPLRAIEIMIECNFDDDTKRSNMMVWLSFWSVSMHQAELHRLQKINDNRLYSHLSHYFKQLIADKDRAQMVARGLAALIDGLWLHGSLRREQFDVKQAREIALQYFMYYLYTAVAVALSYLIFIIKRLWYAIISASKKKQPENILFSGCFDASDYKVRATSTKLKHSNWSPSMMSLKFLIIKPHSKPCFTSLTSSL